MRAPLPVIALAAVLLAAGCARGGDRDDVRSITEAFYTAVDRGDGAAACEALGDDTRQALASDTGRPCPEAVTALDLAGGRATRVEVFVTNAVVELAGGDTAFLSQGTDGWELSAVGCRPEQGRPTERPLACEAEA